MSWSERCCTAPPPSTDSRNQNLPREAAHLSALAASFWSLRETGITRSHLSSTMTSARRRTTATTAAFSKSVSCTSGLRNSTRQPMPLSTRGGGLKRTFPQFVPRSWSQWSASLASSMSKRSSKMTRGSLTSVCATWRLRRGSTPASVSRPTAGACTGTSTSFAAPSAAASLARPSPMKRSQGEVREFRTRPSSSSQRSSQDCWKAGHRVSVSATRPRRKGVAAVSARKRGARTRNWSVRYLASSMFRARKVACMQHWQAPKAWESR
mmetsp:Transcript_74247/g.234502  ORF Transcript_74247/g.234502 Transcript_74247/m.234502 type:complete len:267 (+) Transcript_74247:508-1308(+)